MEVRQPLGEGRRRQQKNFRAAPQCRWEKEFEQGEAEYVPLLAPAAAKCWERQHD